MEDLRQKFISILPHLSEDELVNLLDTCKDLGVTCVADLAYVEVDDFSNVLRKIDARKLMKYVQMTLTGASNQNQNLGDPCSPQSCAPQASAATPPLPRLDSTPTSSAGAGRRSLLMNTPNYLWVDTFNLQEHRLPTRLRQQLRDGDLDPAKRLEFVRYVVDQVLDLCPAPKKKDLEIVASRIGNVFRKALLDDDGDAVIGTGFDALARQLVARVDNARRTPRAGQKRLIMDPDSPQRLVKMADQYGCVKWQPLDLPDDETEESLEERRVQLVHAFEEGKSLDKEAAVLTYFSQRCNINQRMSVREVKSRWPHLFTVDGAELHFEELTGMTLLSSLRLSFEQKGMRIFSYMQGVKKPKIRSLVSRIVEAQLSAGDKSALCPGIVLLLLEYFEEQADVLLVCAEETTNTADIPADLPPTPCIIACGESVLTAKRFMVTMDGTALYSNLPSFVTAVAMLFGLFFNMNVQYPEGGAVTLEFLQRSFLKINPGRGSKSAKKKALSGTHPKVLAITKKLGSFEFLS